MILNKTPFLEITSKEDGTWLHFKTSTGLSHAVCLESLAHIYKSKSSVMRRALLQWCKEFKTSPPTEPPQLRKSDKDNFMTLRTAIKNNQCCLLSSVRKSNLAPVALVCAVNYDQSKEENQMIPLAVMVEGNPFDDFLPPDPLLVKESTEPNIELPMG